MTLRYCGNPDALRFFVERADGFLWTGETWAEDRSAALLFADLRTAHGEYNRLQLEPYQGKPVQEFECRLILRVHGDKPFTLETLRGYLMRALRITVDVEAQGDGPVGGVFVLPIAMLDSLREE